MANPTITINATGITVSGPLIAGEPLAVTASGLSLPEGAALTLALSSRAPNALLASCVLAESEETPGTWTGTLETASRQMAVYFATAAADDTRPAVLELVETTTRDSLALLVTSIRNSALIPSSSPCAVAPVYLPIPGPAGPQVDPSDSAPQMDGTAAAGTSDEYARGDHVHPTDTSRASASDLATVSENATTALNGVNALDRAVQTIGGMIPSTASPSNKLTTAVDLSGKQDTISDLATIRSGAAAGATAVQPSALSAYRTATAQDVIDGAQDAAIAAKYTKPSTGIPESDLAPGVIPTVPSASDTAPLMDGAAAPGVSPDFSRTDHTHPTSRNILRIATASSGVALAPETAIYRAPIAADGSFPALDAAGIQTGAQYYRFGLELAVPNQIPATLSAPSAWQWMPGKSLPDPSTLRPPTTLHIDCRMDCSSASRPIVAACDWVDGPVDVEYLESTSGQYIDTGVPNGEPFTVFLDFSIDASAETNDSLFGSFSSSSRRMIYVTALTNGKKRLQLSHGGSGNSFSVGDLVAGTRHTVKVHQAGAFSYQVDGGNIGTRDFGSDLAAQSGVTLWLFNRSGTSNPCNMRLYSAQIRDANDVLIRDYQPVRVGVTGELYDSVNQTLATRVGTFVVGPDKNA